MILKEKFSLSPFLSPTTPKNVFSLKCGEFELAYNQFNFSYTVNCENLLEASASRALPCLLQFRNPSFTAEDDVQSLQEKSCLCTNVTSSSTKKTLAKFSASIPFKLHNYFSSFVLNSLN